VLSCSDCLARHSEYLDGLLDAATAEQFRAHIAACAECERYDRVLRRGQKMLAAQAQIQVSGDFMTQLQNRLVFEDRRAAMRPMTSLAGVSVAVAAMLAFAAWIPVLILASDAERVPAAVAQADAVTRTSSEIAWHAESAVEESAPTHIHFARRAAWVPRNTHDVISPRYSPVVLASPIAPLNYSAAYGAE
jgi:anti-sigma factor RsiW